MAEQTPVERILIDKPRVKVEAEKSLRQLGIITLEELTNHSAIDLRVKGVGPKTIEYLKECLHKEGLSFSKDSDVKTFGIFKAEQVLFEVLQKMSKRFPGKYFSANSIHHCAYHYVPQNYPEISRKIDVQWVFSSENINSMLRKEGPLEKYVDCAEVVGLMRINEEREHNHFYRLKQPQGAK